MIKIDWVRVLRTAIQATIGAGIALLTSIQNGFSMDSLVASLITFATTILIAILMNIKGQVDDENSN